MFDTGLPGPENLADADDSMVIAAITGWGCVEAAASARRLAAIVELVRRRADGPADCTQWSCDNYPSNLKCLCRKQVRFSHTSDG